VQHSFSFAVPHEAARAPRQPRCRRLDAVRPEVLRPRLSTGLPLRAAGTMPVARSQQCSRRASLINSLKCLELSASAQAGEGARGTIRVCVVRRRSVRRVALRGLRCCFVRQTATSLFSYGFDVGPGPTRPNAARPGHERLLKGWKSALCHLVATTSRAGDRPESGPRPGSRS
jgi:hypothetical protein